MMFGLSSISVIRLQNTIGQHIEKKFIRPYQTIGDHFCVEPKRSNIDIGKDIKSMLENMKKSDLLKKYFVDSSIFDETYMYLDYNAIMSTMRA